MNTSFWQRLPYLLFAIGLVEEDKARELCREAVRIYDSEPDAERHFLSVFMCSPESPVGRELRRFVAGECINDLPLLAEERATLLLTPTTEESIEGKHAIVSRGLRHATNITPAYISINVLRAKLLERLLDARPEVITWLAASLPSRQPVQIAIALGLLAHPVLSDQMRKRSNMISSRSITHSLLTLVVYRCDAETQFASHKDADNRMSSRRKGIEKQQTKAGG